MVAHGFLLTGHVIWHGHFLSPAATRCGRGVLALPSVHLSTTHNRLWRGIPRATRTHFFILWSPAKSLLGVSVPAIHEAKNLRDAQQSSFGQYPLSNLENLENLP